MVLIFSEVLLRLLGVALHRTRSHFLLKPQRSSYLPQKPT